MTTDATDLAQPGIPAAARRGPAYPAGIADDANMWSRISRLCLLVAVFFSGWTLLRVGSINLTFSDLAFLACLAIVAMQGRLNAVPFGPLTPFWIAGLAIMLGGLFVSSIINGDPLRWANVAIQYTVAYLFIPLLLMQQEQRLTRILPMMFVLGTTLSEAIGIASTFVFTFNDTVDLLGDGFITGNHRLGAMAGQPNPNGAVIAFSLPMLIYAVSKETMPRLVGLLCGIILLWGLMLSASFTGFFASVLAITLTLALMGLQHVVRLGLIVAVAAGLFVASGAPLPKAFQERVGSAVETGDINQAGTFVNRSELIAEAWNFAEDTTIVGMGVDRYRELSHHDNPVHNLYLLIWNEGGSIAFIGLVVLLALLCAMAAAGLRRSREGGAMACAVVVVFLIYTASYPHMYSRMWVMPIMVALSVIYVRRDESAGLPRPVAGADEPLRDFPQSSPGRYSRS